MAPEVLDHQSYNSKADIWSIGVAFYELIYGKYKIHYQESPIQLLISSIYWRKLKRILLFSHRNYILK